MLTNFTFRFSSLSIIILFIIIPDVAACHSYIAFIAVNDVNTTLHQMKTYRFAGQNDNSIIQEDSNITGISITRYSINYSPPNEFPGSETFQHAIADIISSSYYVYWPNERDYFDIDDGDRLIDCLGLDYLPKTTPNLLKN